MSGHKTLVAHRRLKTPTNQHGDFSTEAQNVQLGENSLYSDLKLGRIDSWSSLSDENEYEIELTKKLHEKLKRIDRVLKKQEDFPHHYDREEIALWMNTFPNVHIFDSKPTCDSKRDLSSVDRSSSRKCDQKAPYVANNSDFTYNRLLSQRSTNNSKKHTEDNNGKHKNIFSISSRHKNIDVDKSLKITPLKRVSDTKIPTKSFKRLQNDYTDYHSQFDSLPFINLEVLRENRKPSDTYRNEKLTKSSSLTKNDLLILPPINSDRLRSISATPSQDKPKLFII
ncbi:unnamed protein product [Phyllotreta striolata]|uniref:Uncharacterized protein n=1 Tax=Phyllotreta striolata TaxID=444603 RepID=A0A9N9TXK8_PHYSR|nr:unnamed protein product [Phyllotreta striolata]